MLDGGHQIFPLEIEKRRAGLAASAAFALVFKNIGRMDELPDDLEIDEPGNAQKDGPVGVTGMSGARDRLHAAHALQRRRLAGGQEEKAQDDEQ